MTTVDLIRERLAVLEPTELLVNDESAAHAGHAGASAHAAANPGAAAEGSHFHVTIVSPRFDGQLPLARHRMVYAALGDLMQSRIHALRIDAFCPGQW